MDQGQPEADGQAPVASNPALVGGAQDDDQEHGGHDHLGHQGSHHRVLAGRQLAEAVDRQAVGGQGEPLVATSDEQQDKGRSDGTENLGDDVGRQVGKAEPAT